MLELRQLGHSYRAIAERLDCPYATVQRALAGAPQPRRTITRDGTRWVTRADEGAARRREQALALRRQGLSIAAVAAELGVSYGTAYKDLADEPPPERVVGLDGSVRARGLRARAMELYAEEKTVAEIAEILGLSRSTVARAVADDEWWLDSSGEDVHWRPTGGPPEELRHLLQEARRRGADFHHAWEIALTGVFWPGRFLTRTERDQWAEAFAWAMPYFRAAYYGEGEDPLGALRLEAV